MSKTLTLKINRTGVIPIADWEKFPCVGKGHPVLYYHCAVEFENPLLDDRGFLLAHEEIDDEITRKLKKIKAPSCEIIAELLVNIVSHFLDLNGKKYKSVYVKLSGRPDFNTAWMEAFLTVKDS